MILQIWPCGGPIILKTDIEQAGPGYTRGVLLLQRANDNCRQILFSLENITGKTVQSSAEAAKCMNP